MRLITHIRNLPDYDQVAPDTQTQAAVNRMAVLPHLGETDMEKKKRLSLRQRLLLGGLTSVTLFVAGVCFAYPRPPDGYAGVIEYYVYTLPSNGGDPEIQVVGQRVYSPCAQGGPLTSGAQSRDYRIVFIPCP